MRTLQHAGTGGAGEHGEPRAIDVALHHQSVAAPDEAAIAGRKLEAALAEIAAPWPAYPQTATSCRHWRVVIRCGETSAPRRALSAATASFSGDAAAAEALITTNAPMTAPNRRRIIFSSSNSPGWTRAEGGGVRPRCS